MSDFEAFFWYAKSQRELLPERVRLASERYFNRPNGFTVGFRNTSFEPEPTNWTTFAQTEEDEEDGEELSPIDL
eukprot:CAMPEP_0170485168 /NCGR_PEP_ID=MMETSP0208-20121228/4488_1 /TAXON_ID=197538 /ORGANISM="Strombidium inclinatum, Strain S3" /LENGTH=73 /DNA_ID=CAMNT_0010758727 /DNA_START=289 /DNA_END=506 /DNA_ORIENTATION=-